MKLIPKAKPVRIRILSGGIEHSSLDSLLQNFDIDMVKLLKSERLMSKTANNQWTSNSDKVIIYTKKKLAFAFNSG